MTDERITDDEAAYHRAVVERIKGGREMRQEADAAEAAFRSWAEHLHKKYGIEPGDGIDENGTIVRQASVEGSGKT